MNQDFTDRKKAEEELRESEKRFRGMAERSPDLVFILDKSMSPTYVSPSSLTIIGYDPEELVGKSPEFARATFFSQTGPELMLAVQATMNGVSCDEVEIQLTKKDGTPVHVSVHAVPVMHDGTFEGAQVTMRDITRRKRVETALKESEAKYRLLADNVHDVIWTAGKDMQMTYISPSVTALRGLTSEEAMAEPFRNALTPASYQMLMKYFPKRSDDSEKGQFIHGTRTMELEYRRRDGSTVWTETIITPVFDSEKNLVSAVGVTRDISLRKHTEAVLRESEEKFRSIVETSPDMIWEIDMEGKFQYISPQVQKIMGYAPEEMIGRSIGGLVTERTRSAAMAEWAKTISSEGSFSPIEVASQHRNGGELIIEIRPWRLTGDDGTPKGFRGVAVDITKRKRAEDALRRANRQLNLLTGITRHDILNKVSVILGFLRIAGIKFRDPVLAGYLERMVSATTEIQSQIEFTKVYENIGTHEPQWIGLDTVIPRAQAPATVTLHAAVQGVSVFADPMLEKVFFNLLDNSIRHGQRVTEIRVSSLRSGEDLVVVWEDNGVGIAVDEKERIFERGFGKNTGLGMFLVREILSLTGISIKETGEPGKGARFEIVIPRKGFRNG